MANRYPTLIIFLSTIYFLVSCNPAPSPLPQSPTSLPAPIQPTTLPSEESELPPVPDLPIVAYNEIVEGQLETPGAIGSWAFEAKAGERVNIVINSQFDSYLELYSPADILIASNDDNDQTLQAALFDVQITESGLHTIVVRAFNQATGSYALALAGGHPTANTSLLENGDVRAVILSNQGTKWHYTGQQDTYLNIITDGAEGVDSYLSLYGPDGRLLISDDDSGSDLNAEIFEFQLPADGLYTLRAHTIAETGPVTLTLSSSLTLSGGGAIKSGQTQSGDLTSARPHRWTFQGTAGQAISLAVSSVDFDTFLELRDSQDVILSENDDTAGGTDSRIDQFILPRDDTYSIIVRGLSDQDRGAYEVTLETVDIPSGGGSLVADTTMEVALLPGYVDNWFFTAPPGSFVTISTTSALLDTYLELYDEAGNLILEDDDSGGELNAALVEVPIESDGEYHVVVRAAQENEQEGGVYEIALTLSEETVTTDQLEVGDLRTVVLEAGAQHTYTFTAAADDKITIQMASDTLDTHLSLYDSEGTLLTLNDDYFGIQAAIFNYIIPADGEYRVVARAYSANEAGEYTISLQINEEAATLQEDQEQ